MTTLRIETLLRAPMARCFDLARSVEAHLHSTDRTGERVVGGRASGLFELDDEVTWEARHFGVRQRFTSRITAFDPPGYFQDRMLRGAFRSFEHDHHFQITPDGLTLMIDTVRFTAPLWPAGLLVERTILKPYLRRFLTRRVQALQTLAESDSWRKYVEA